MGNQKIYYVQNLIFENILLNKPSKCKTKKNKKLWNHSEGNLKMYNFEGNYRRLPLQSLGGSSIETDRQTLIKKAQLERKKREEIRKKEVAVLRIQSLLR